MWALEHTHKQLKNNSKKVKKNAGHELNDPEQCQPASLQVSDLSWSLNLSDSAGLDQTSVCQHEEALFFLLPQSAPW